MLALATRDGREQRGKGLAAFTRLAMRARPRCGFETIGADGSPAADVARPVTDARVKESSPSHGAYSSRLVRPGALIPHKLVIKGKDTHLHFCRCARLKTPLYRVLSAAAALMCVTQTSPFAPIALWPVRSKGQICTERSVGEGT